MAKSLQGINKHGRLPCCVLGVVTPRGLPPGGTAAVTSWPFVLRNKQRDTALFSLGVCSGRYLLRRRGFLFPECRRGKLLVGECQLRQLEQLGQLVVQNERRASLSSIGRLRRRARHFDERRERGHWGQRRDVEHRQRQYESLYPDGRFTDGRQVNNDSLPT